MNSVLVSPETVKNLTSGAKSVLDVATGTVNELSSEAINLFLVDSFLHILKFAAVFVVFFIIKKYIDLMMEANKENAGIFKAFKTCALVGSIVFFTAQSFPHIQEIAKALVAPKIFLLEKTASIVNLKKVDSGTNTQ